MEGITAPILDKYGVNQGGNASPTLFRNYLSGLGDDLTHTHGLCVSETIVAHLLWPDDLTLISDSHEGLQKQLGGLQTFCTKNVMILYELKTKVMAFGKCDVLKVHFNGKNHRTGYKFHSGTLSRLCLLGRGTYSVTTMTTCSVKHKKLYLQWKTIYDI